MARLTITAFGSLQATLDDQPVTAFAYDKVRALLAYLAIQQAHPIHRDLLADLLWPNQPTTSARKQLRSALATLRGAIDDAEAAPPFLLISRDRLQFNPLSDHFLDVQHFGRLLDVAAGHNHGEGQACADCAEQLAEAVNLYRGVLLDQLVLRDCPAWEEWVTQQREMFHQQVCQALQRLMHYSAAGGQRDKAQAYARQLLNLDPWDEGAYRCLMLSLYQAGKRAAALQQYEQLRKVLADELGVEPSAESLALQQQILADELMVGSQRVAPQFAPGESVVQPEVLAVQEEPPAREQAGPQGQARRTDRNQQRMLERVRAFWVDGVLERSLHTRVLLSLGLDYTSEVTRHPWHMLFQSGDEALYELPGQADIVAMYDQLEGELLILGAPGAGKTTMLLQLARTLLRRAESDGNLPMPVIFHLSSWAAQRLPISTWLVEELIVRYQVPRRLAQKWVSDKQVLPLLDGLDEVVAEQRVACVEALNQFRDEHWLLGTVVCSRTTDYAALGVRLRLRGAVVVQPLNNTQIEAYLQQGGEQLGAVRRLLSEDRLLYELANTPLMLSIIVIAYQGAATTVVPRLSSLDERRKHLFATYTQRMLARRIQPRYHPQQTMRALIWLARMMLQRSQSVFLIESLQPDWLGGKLREHYAPLVLLIVSLIIGLGSGIANGVASSVLALLPNLLIGGVVGIIGGLLAGVFTWLMVWMGERLLQSDQRWGDLTKPNWWQAMLQAVPFAAAMGIAVAITVGAGYSTGEGLAFGVITAVASLFLLILMRQTGRIQLVEAYRWSLRRALRGFLPGALLGLTVGLVLGIAYWSTAGVASALVLLFGTMFAFGLTSQGLEQTTVPNQGIWRTGRHALSIAIVVGVIASCVHGLTNGLTQGQQYGIAVGITAGLNDMLIGGIIVGGIACIRHFVLRLLLWRAGYVPWNYARFLDYAADLLFLQKTGGSYIFTHRLLMEYFASLRPETEQIQPSPEEGLAPEARRLA
jgi:DNA-binding SARP family transcriptional activator/DNA polymerase III delta prime subunit